LRHVIQTSGRGPGGIAGEASIIMLERQRVQQASASAAKKLEDAAKAAEETARVTGRQHRQRPKKHRMGGLSDKDL